MRVLFITYTNIGDAILSTALLQRILTEHPDALVDVVVGQGAATLFKGMPNLNEVIPLVKRKYHGHYWYLWQKLRHRHYDVIVDLRTAVLGRLLKGKRKIYYKQQPHSHKATQLAALWDGDASKAKLMFWEEPECAAKVAAFLNQHHFENAPLVALAPTANWIGKRWPQWGFAEVIKQVEKQFANAAPAPVYVVFGAAHERKTIADLLATLPRERTVDLVGRTSLPEAASWLNRADIFLGNDSGLGHLAAAAGKRCISLFGPTSEVVYAPFGDAHVIVKPEERLYHRVNLEPSSPKRLVTDIAPEQVSSVLIPALQQWYDKEKV